MWINPTSKQVFVTHSAIRAEFPNVSFPANITDDMVASMGLLPVTLTPPGHNPATHSATEDTPALVDGVWTQQWEINAWPDDVTADNLARIESKRVVALWQAAHDYEYAQISGSAIGLLAIGVMTGKPKCLAIQAWIKAVWTIYYTRKADTSTDCDYSGAGECPHSVPELMAELGV